MSGPGLQFRDLINAVDRILIKAGQYWRLAVVKLELQRDGLQVFLRSVLFIFMTVDGGIYLFYLAGTDLIEIDDTGVIFFGLFFRDQQFSPGPIQTDDHIA